LGGIVYKNSPWSAKWPHKNTMQIKLYCVKKNINQLNKKRKEKERIEIDI